MSEHHDSSTRSVLNVPNTLTLIRLFGASLLVGLALLQHERAFLWMFIALILTDLIDGRLAAWLHQRTQLGARLDSLADVTLYAALMFGFVLLKWDFLAANWQWILVPAVCYGLSVVVSYVKFGRAPSYHTYGAKVSAHLVVLGVFCVFAAWGSIPFYVASVAVTATNLEAVLITLLLSSPAVDVPSAFHASGRAN